jgi:hypothetical protein
MEAKGKSENQKANLEIILESIAEDLHGNINSSAKLFDSIENLSQKIDRLVSDKNDRQNENEDFSKEMKLGFARISESISKTSFSLDRLQKLSEISERNSQQQKTAQETKVIHHHHISKGILVAIILFILLSLESAGWLNTVYKLDQYSENDTKYRFMRLDTTAKNLQIYLDSTDARYKSDPNMHNMVIELEDQYQKNMERLEKAEHLKQEAKNLENKVHFNNN